MAAALPTTIKPTYAGVSKNIAARTLETDFGDGYRQRVADGINNINREYDLEWVGTDTDIEELITHFEERAGYQDFTWTPDGETTQYKWTCKEWTRVHISNSFSRLTATLRQEFDLG